MQNPPINENSQCNIPKATDGQVNVTWRKLPPLGFSPDLSRLLKFLINILFAMQMKLLLQAGFIFAFIFFPKVLLSLCAKL